jgi:hypothetical protein
MNYTIKMCIWAGIFVLGLGMMVSCSHQTSPVGPDSAGREGQSFGSANDILQTANTNALDMAVLCSFLSYNGNGPSSSGNPAYIAPAGPSPTNHYYTAVVSTAASGSGDVVQLAWLRDGSTSPVYTGNIVTPASGVEYGFPRCDAMYRPGQFPGYGDIYLAVAYQKRVDSGDWNIEYKILHWTQADFFYFAGPTSVHTHPIDDSYNQLYPDVAFNFVIYRGGGGRLSVKFIDSFSIINTKKLPDLPGRFCARERKSC